MNRSGELNLCHGALRVDCTLYLVDPDVVRGTQHHPAGVKSCPLGGESDGERYHTIIYDHTWVEGRGGGGARYNI